MSALEKARHLATLAETLHKQGQEQEATACRAESDTWARIALAEEQRTANLIAALERDAIQPPHQTAAANAPFWNALAADITERLDLA